MQQELVKRPHFIAQLWNAWDDDRGEKQWERDQWMERWNQRNKSKVEKKRAAGEWPILTRILGTGSYGN